jgi:hypothetical protein
VILTRNGNRDVICTDLMELVLDNALGKVGPVAVAAQVREKHAAESVARHFAGECGGGIIAEVSVAAHDALLEHPGPRGVLLQQFQIMVGFEHERIGVADAFDDEFCRVTEVREHSDGLRAVADSESHGVLRIVRDTEGIDGQVTNFKRVASREESP